MMAVLVVPGCSEDDDPVLPDPGINSFDDSMDKFKSALIANDNEAIESLFDVDSGYFSFRFRDEDVEELSLSSNYLNLAEMAQVWRNFFSGQEFVNHAGELVSALTNFEVSRFDRTTEWMALGSNDATIIELVYGVRHAFYRVRISLQQEGSLPLLQSDVLLDFKVRPPCTDYSCHSEHETYNLWGIVSDLWAEEEYNHLSFGKLVYMFFTNEAPSVELVTESEEYNHLHVRANTCLTLDSGFAIRNETIRWRFQPGDEWTEWSNDCEETFLYSTYGEKTISVEVRDHWGLSTQVDQVIELIP